MSILLSMVVLLVAARGLDWHAWLADKTRQHLCFGAAIALVPLWMLQAGVKEGLEIHFLGLTTLALMLGWRLSQLTALLSLLLVTLFGVESWSDFGINLLLGVILPLAVSYFVFLLSYSYLYRHLFVYIFVAGFFNGALAIAAKTLAFAGYLTWSGQYAWPTVLDNYVSILPLLLFPEALLNGMAITLLVVFRPQWVRTFYDRDYLNNK
ncbi:energy-coupling factor ABC transporter permease [Zobellella iuensis]|uniref:Energy-coupling factor ABC transporter permease n=1 Tax=Zobellella iuensis TaxID=2803811 RepID=A0ABS1QSU8_9GAMM|nr:energy-coupling factor ABC transporter permease [Zobellella iuensis]MBL1377536.1 energy-coupling factor ABC transporter permease [Zobellella iuensis]